MSAATATFSMSTFNDSEARRITADLAGKYDGDAINYVAARVERAVEIGDEIAQAIWRQVLNATSELLRR